MPIEINLLPENKKEEIARAERFRSVLGWEMIAFLIGAAVISFLVGVGYLLDFELKADDAMAKNGLSGEQYQTIDYYQAKFTEINAKLNKIVSIDASQLYWSRLFLKLDAIVPSGVEISALSSKDYAVYLTGKAKNRDDLILFKERLSQDDCFQDVNLPLSDLVSKENIAFQIDLDVNSDCIKNR